MLLPGEEPVSSPPFFLSDLPSTGRQPSVILTGEARVISQDEVKMMYLKFQ